MLMHSPTHALQHPVFTRRSAIRAGAIGLLGLGMNHVQALQAAGAGAVDMTQHSAKPTDWPAIAAVAGAARPPRNNLPPAVILPERLIHSTGRVIPGPYAGMMGRLREPWLIEASPYDPMRYGAYPEYAFDHQDRPQP